MKISLRKATLHDQSAIRRLISAAGINPMGLRWQRFVVAEADGRIVGTGQIKHHGDGSDELASIAVIPEYQRSGIATQIITALLADHAGPLHLLCTPDLEGFYRRFGFQRIASTEMPPYFRRLVRAAGYLMPIIRRFTSKAHAPIVMRREIK